MTSEVNSCIISFRSSYEMRDLIDSLCTGCRAPFRDRTAYITAAIYKDLGARDLKIGEARDTVNKLLQRPGVMENIIEGMNRK